MTDAHEVEALTEQVAMEHLKLLAGAVRPGECIVELGVYQGASLAYLAYGSRKGVHTYGIDPWGMEKAYVGRSHMRKRYPAEGMKIAQRHLFENGVDGTTTLVRGLSTEVAAQWQVNAIGVGTLAPVGLLFIDAVHREKEVMEDFYAWLPLLAKDATVAFDDHDERFDGVRRAVKRIVAAGDLEWIELVGSRLAVLRRP